MVYETFGFYMVLVVVLVPSIAWIRRGGGLAETFKNAAEPIREAGRLLREVSVLLIELELLASALGTLWSLL